MPSIHGILSVSEVPPANAGESVLKYANIGSFQTLGGSLLKIIIL
jgi:hypothetical protein